LLLHVYLALNEILKLLLDRLQHVFGITETALNWFYSYITNRTQTVGINGSSSSPMTLDYGVPQGSVLGPYLFTIYTHPLSELIQSHGVNYHLYADDTQLYMPMSTNDSSTTMEMITNCVNDIKSWMSSNKLKLNDDKTELIVFKKKSTKRILNEISINDNVICASPCVRNLGLFLDEHLGMQSHITKLCQTVHFHLRNISRVRDLLDEDTCKLLVHSLVTSRLDYCNSLFYGLPASSLGRLQALQNSSARIITRTKKRDHISPVMQSLHWLPVDRRIDFKIACTVFKCIHDSAPDYLKCLIQIRKPNRTLRSSTSLLLERKMSKSKFLDRSFIHAAPAVWNSLSEKTRNCQTLASFKRSLKTEFFRSVYSM
jgi:hypothetical protein